MVSGLREVLRCFISPCKHSDIVLHSARFLNGRTIILVSHDIDNNNYDDNNNALIIIIIITKS